MSSSFPVGQWVSLLSLSKIHDLEFFRCHGVLWIALLSRAFQTVCLVLGLTKLNENNSLWLVISYKRRKELVRLCILPSLLHDTEMLLKMNIDHENSSGLIPRNTYFHFKCTLNIAVCTICASSMKNPWFFEKKNIIGSLLQCVQGRKRKDTNKLC